MGKTGSTLSLTFVLIFGVQSPLQSKMPGGEINTFSIVAFDPTTEEIGVAVQSKFFGVGSVVPFAKAGVGAVATQSYANVSFGPRGLDLLGGPNPLSPEDALDLLLSTDDNRESRQVSIIAGDGATATFTGNQCNDWAGHHQGEHFSVQGNLLTGPEVIDAMTMAFESSRSSGEGELADWMIAALQAGQAAGGDKRGQQSAAILVTRREAGYGGYSDRYIDLRVEDHPKPIDQLEALLEKHKSFYRRAHQKGRELREAGSAAPKED